MNFADLIIIFRHWLFGEKIQMDVPKNDESLLRIRGWFPKKCAVIMVESPNENIPYKKHD